MMTAYLERAKYLKAMTHDFLKKLGLGSRNYEQKKSEDKHHLVQSQDCIEEHLNAVKAYLPAIDAAGTQASAGNKKRQAAQGCILQAVGRNRKGKTVVKTIFFYMQKNTDPLSYYDRLQRSGYFEKGGIKNMTPLSAEDTEALEQILADENSEGFAELKEKGGHFRLGPQVLGQLF